MAISVQPQIVRPVTPAASGKSVANSGTGYTVPNSYGSSRSRTVSQPSDLNSISDWLGYIAQNAQANNTWSAQQAQKQMDFQTASQKSAQEFNAAEAAKNRNWQEYMSNTAHQREVADLRAAGLNPVLSAMGGNGAAVGSGATASSSSQSGAQGQTDTSANAAITGLLSTFLSAQTNMEMQRISAQTTLAQAERMAAASELVGSMNAGATQYMAQQSAMAQMYSAKHNSKNVRYQTDMNYKLQQWLTNTNQQNKIAFEEMFPSSLYNSLSSILSEATGLNGTQAMGNLLEGAIRSLGIEDWFNMNSLSNNGAGRK